MAYPSSSSVLIVGRRKEFVDFVESRDDVMITVSFVLSQYI
jgi:hypothetical protein